MKSKSIQERITNARTVTVGFPSTGSRLEMLIELAKKRSAVRPVGKTTKKIGIEWHSESPVELDYQHFGNRRHD